MVHQHLMAEVWLHEDVNSSMRGVRCLWSVLKTSHHHALHHG